MSSLEFSACHNLGNALNHNFNKDSEFLSLLLEVSPFDLSGKILDSIRFREDAPKTHLSCNSNDKELINMNIFKTFVYLSNAKKKVSFSHSICKRKVDAVCVAFDAVHNDFIQFNIFIDTLH